MNKETTTKEERILENLDRGEPVVSALLGVEADTVDAALYETLVHMKDTATPVPSRDAFAQLLTTLPIHESVASPYQGIRSPFMHLRFMVPALLGVLVIISGVGIETGRINIDTSIVSAPVVTETEPSAMTQSKSLDTNSSTLQALRATDESAASTSSSIALAPTEENYDAYFEEESNAFMSIADAYEVTI